MQAGLRGALGSAATQGVGVATGLQEGFSWAGVAAAGVGAMVGQLASEGLGGGLEYGEDGRVVGGHTVVRNSAGDVIGFEASLGNALGSSAASGIANAATRSAVEGSNFGDNLVAALPDVVGQALGRAVGGRLSSHQRQLMDRVNATPTEGDYTQLAQVGGADTLPNVLPGGAAAGAPGVSWDGYGFNFDMPASAELDAVLWEIAATDAVVDALAARESPGLLSWIGGARLTATTLGPMALSGWLHGLGADMATSNYTAGGNGLADVIGRGVGGALMDISNPWQAAKNTAVSVVDFPGNLFMSAAFATHGGYAALTGDEAGAALNFALASDHGTEGAIGAITLMTAGAGRSARYGVDGIDAAGRRAAIAPTVSADDFIGPTIGTSRYRNFGEVEAAIQTRYQQAINDGFVLAQQREAQGLLNGLASTRVGSFVDGFARRDLQAFANFEGFGDDIFRINRRLYDPTGGGAYRIPDAYFVHTNRIFDATIGMKTPYMSQVNDFLNFSGGRVTVLKPYDLDSAFSVPRR